MKVKLETERLYLRQFIVGDTLDIFQLNNSDEVLQYTGDIPFSSRTDAETFIQNYISQVYTDPETLQSTGLGRLAVLKKESHEFIGWCGLKFHQDRFVTDLGFRLHKCYWNKGYATEAAKASIHFAFDTLKLPSLVGHCHIQNESSQRVLEKCGFTKKDQIVYDGQPTLLYELENRKYSLRQIQTEETWPVRHPVLRAGRPLKDVYMEADEMETTFHLGMFYNNEIVGVASFMEDSDPLFSGSQVRLRGMAVLPRFRKKGLAGLLLEQGETLLRSKNKSLLWFNARIAAVPFYKKMGYEVVGEEFDIPKVGPHFKMKKIL